jgi:hypothetical protein
MCRIPRGGSLRTNASSFSMSVARQQKRKSNLNRHLSHVESSNAPIVAKQATNGHDANRSCWPIQRMLALPTGQSPDAEVRLGSGVARVVSNGQLAPQPSNDLMTSKIGAIRK